LEGWCERGLTGLLGRKRDPGRVREGDERRRGVDSGKEEGLIGRRGGGRVMERGEVSMTKFRKHRTSSILSGQIYTSSYRTKSEWLTVDTVELLLWNHSLGTPKGMG
jgi:hypothetical protein